eukprot:EG_transcript_8268
MTPHPAVALFRVVFCCFIFWFSTAFDSHQLPTAVEIAKRMTANMTPAEHKGPIILTESNSEFHPMTVWWIQNMHKLGLTKFLIIAMDIKEYHRLKHMGLFVFWTHGLNVSHSDHFSTPSYIQIVNYRWKVVVDLLHHGFDVLMTDVDIYWRRNPLPYLQSLPRCHMYLSTDVTGLSEDETSPQIPKPRRLYPPFTHGDVLNKACLGFSYFVCHPLVIKVAETVLQKAIGEKHDQDVFNVHLMNLLQTNKNESRIFHGADTCGNYGNLTFHILRPDLFQNYRIHTEYPEFKQDSVEYLQKIYAQTN